ncbi:hypothetical protein JXO52_07875 [bacterium]|nr:hypothetical protein [bacterium]
MKKLLLILLSVILVSGIASAQNPMGLVLTTPGLHAIAPTAFQGGVGLQLPMGNFDLRPALGFNTASTSNGVDQSTTSFDLGMDLLLPLGSGFFSTYFGGGIGFGIEKEKEEGFSGETTVSTSGFGFRGLFGIKCEPVKNLTIATEVYLAFRSESTTTEYHSNSMAKAAAPLASEYKGSQFYLSPAGTLILTFWFNK